MSPGCSTSRRSPDERLIGLISVGDLGKGKTTSCRGASFDDTKRLFPAELLCRALRGAGAFAFDNALAGSRRTGSTSLLHSRLDVAAQEGTFDILLGPELDVAHGFAIAFKNSIRIGEGASARESQVDVLRVGGDVTEHILHLAAEPEPNGHGVDLVDRLGGVGRFFKDHVAEREGEIGDMPVVGFEEAEELGIRGTWHGGGDNIHRIAGWKIAAANVSIGFAENGVTTGLGGWERPAQVVKTALISATSITSPVSSCRWPPSTTMSLTRMVTAFSEAAMK